MNPVHSWTLALGGQALTGWIRNPSGPLYLYGPKATGKSLFQRAWHTVKGTPAVITGQDESGKDLGFYNGAAQSRADLSQCVRIKVKAPCTAADEVMGLKLDQIVVWLKAGQ